MDEPFDPAPAAALLADAWRSGRLLDELPLTIRPRTLAEGYDIQDRLIAALDPPLVGWKLGVGSAVQKRQSGVGRSIAGRVLGSRTYRGEETVPLPNAAPATIEFEIAYVLSRDVLPSEPVFAVLDAVAEMRVAFEVVLSRFVDRRAVGWPSFAADNAGFEALVIGDALSPADIGGLIETLVVLADGQETARPLTGDDATDPETALADLVATARERGMILPSGSVVSTGTVSKPFNVAAPTAEIVARYLDREFGFQTRVNQT